MHMKEAAPFYFFKKYFQRENDRKNWPTAAERIV